jgi:hypothetical protein
MIRDRLITICEDKGLTAKKLQELTGIDREKWYALRGNKRRANEEDIEAILAITPQYALWLVSGNIAPEAGQVSPAYEEANLKLEGQNAGSN